MGEKLILLGIGIIMLGFLLVLLGSMLSILKTGKTKTEGGFIFFIGPFPIGGATSKEVFYALLAVSIILIVVFLLIGRGMV